MFSHEFSLLLLLLVVVCVRVVYDVEVLDLDLTWLLMALRTLRCLAADLFGELGFDWNSCSRGVALLPHQLWMYIRLTRYVSLLP